MKDNADSGLLFDNADDNTAANNELMGNGTANGDMTDGIRVNTVSTDNTIQNNQLRNNVTHDCHDDSAGFGTSGTANFWLNNHAGTENPTGLCNGGADAASLEATVAFGWDPDYRWYDLFGVAAEYDWATAYSGIDTDSLLRAVPQIRLGGRGRVPVNPHR